MEDAGCRNDVKRMVGGDVRRMVGGDMRRMVEVM